MKIKIVDINELETYTDTKNIMALNVCKNNVYDILYRVILNNQFHILVSKENFEKLVKLLYGNVEMDIE